MSADGAGAARISADLQRRRRRGRQRQPLQSLRHHFSWRLITGKGSAHHFSFRILHFLLRVEFLVVMFCVRRRKGLLRPPFLIILLRASKFLSWCRLVCPFNRSGKSIVHPPFLMIRLWATVFLLPRFRLSGLWALLLIMLCCPASKRSSARGSFNRVKPR